MTADPIRPVRQVKKKGGTVSGAALLIRIWKVLALLLDPQNHEPHFATLVYKQ